jgi:hypothetical protein
MAEPNLTGDLRSPNTFGKGLPASSLLTRSVTPKRGSLTLSTEGALRKVALLEHKPDEFVEVFGFTSNKIVAHNVQKCDNYVVEAIYNETIDVDAGYVTSIHGTEFIIDESIETSPNGKRSFVCDFCIFVIAAIVIVIGIFFIVNTFVKMV